MSVTIEASWKQLLEKEFEAEYFQTLRSFIHEEYQNQTIYPPPQKIFAAFDAAPVDKIKVVILGQDPYHGPNQANGLCFSVREEVRIPPSLQNIYKEIEADLGKKMPSHGNLERWATQGVLLLNATLTVRAYQAGSHQNRGWEQFTDAAIQKLAQNRENLVFLLWGSYAQKKGRYIDQSKHLILKAPHPSPLSAHRGFFGCKHFSQANEYLWMNGIEPIQW